MELASLGGNWIDLVIVAALLFFFVDGLTDRFLAGLLSLFGFILTFILSLKFYGFAAKFFIDNFSLPHGIANALGFFAVAIIIETIYNIVSALLYKKIPQVIRDSKWNRRLGFLPSIGNGIIVIAFILTLIVTLPTTPFLKKAILDSKIGSLFVLRTQAAETQINSVFGDAVNESLSFLTVHPDAHDKESIDLKFSTKELTIDTQSEERMFALVNEERQKQGLKALRTDNKLKDLARAYAKDMFVRGYFSHYNPEGQSPFDRMSRAGIVYVAAGENLAYAPNVEVAHTGLMNSPGHKANILSPDFGHAGIGVIDGGIYGKMFVQEFTD